MPVATLDLDTDRIARKTEDGFYEILSTKTGKTLRFKGDHVAGTTTKRNNSYRWRELHILRTERGRYVAVEIGRTTFDGEEDFADFQVFETAEDMTRTLGYTRMSRRVFEQMDELGTIVID